MLLYWYLFSLIVYYSRLVLNFKTPCALGPSHLQLPAPLRSCLAPRGLSARVVPRGSAQDQGAVGAGADRSRSERHPWGSHGQRGYDAMVAGTKTDLFLVGAFTFYLQQRTYFCLMVLKITFNMAQHCSNIERGWGSPMPLTITKGSCNHQIREWGWPGLKLIVAT